METSAHWNAVYRAKSEDEVSWFQPSPERSLALIAAADTTDSLIDIGGGASRLVDRLLQQGYGDLTVLDVSDAALERSKARLGAAADRVTWIVSDITRWKPERTWRLWHDRAVFHFLTETAAQDAYIAALEHATDPGATIIIATFALDGPEKCSGLPVQRYSAETLAARLGPNFHLTGHAAEKHRTPWGSEQSFQYAVLRRG